MTKDRGLRVGLYREVFGSRNLLGANIYDVDHIIYDKKDPRGSYLSLECYDGD